MSKSDRETLRNLNVHNFSLNYERAVKSASDFDSEIGSDADSDICSDSESDLSSKKEIEKSFRQSQDLSKL